MQPGLPCRSVAHLLVLALAVGSPLALAGQRQAPTQAMSVDSAFYMNVDDTVGVILHLDSLGIEPAPGVTEAEIGALVGEQGWSMIRRLPGGTFVVGLPEPLAGPDAAFAQGRSLYLTRPELIENSGPLARWADAPRSPIVLTDQFIVLYDPGAPADGVDSLVAAWGAEQILAAPTEPELRLYRTGRETRANVLEVANAFNSSPLTRWAYPDFLEGLEDASPIDGASPAEAPLPTADASATTDDYYKNQWHLENAAGADINVLPAWGITTGDPDVVIAVMETAGFDAGHPDLVPNLWRNEVEIAGDGPPNDDDDGNGYADDYHGWNFKSCVNTTLPCGSNDLASYAQSHGTAVAGLVAAEADNTIGVAGVCPDCRIMLLSVAGGQSGKHLAFLYARDNGADVINASWVMTRQTPLENTIRDVAVGVGGHPGIPIVFAMSNAGENRCVDLPASKRTFVSMPEVIAVGASNNRDKRVLSSDFGPCLRLMAPGGWELEEVGVTTTDLQGKGGYNPAGCVRGEISGTEDYTNCFGGASAAAPIVSGVIGLMLSANPSLERKQVIDILSRTAAKIECGPLEANPAMYGGVSGCPPPGLTHSDTHGFGRVDAGAAVGEADAMTKAQVTTPPPSAEVGARAGWTDISGSSNQTVVGAPGGGPDASPVFHVDLYTGGASGGDPRWMWEIQVGGQRRSTSPPATKETSFVVAFQPAYLFGGAGWYAGPNVAYRYATGPAASASSSDVALGLALGRRYVMLTYLDLRLEARYRHWSSRNLDELGLAIGLGALIP